MKLVGNFFVTLFHSRTRGNESQTIARCSTRGDDCKDVAVLQVCVLLAVTHVSYGVVQVLQSNLLHLVSKTLQLDLSKRFRRW